MLKWIPLIGLVGFLVFLVACRDSPTLGNLKRLVYETPGRDTWAQPDRVVDALGLVEGQSVADIGSGGGYFTFRLAEAVGETGRVYAVDVDSAMLAYVAAQAEARELPQIETVNAPKDGPGLGAGAVDLIFLSNVFHHLPEQDRYFTVARDTLRPGGRVAIIEAQSRIPHFAKPEEIDAAMQAAGFELVETPDFLERQAFRIYAVASEADATQ